MSALAPSLIAFTLAAALLTITPGLDTALVLRTAAAEGARRAFAASLGICFGCLAWGALVAVGLGVLVQAPDGVEARGGPADVRRHIVQDGPLGVAVGDRGRDDRSQER